MMDVIGGNHCPYYQNNAIASQKYDTSSGHMIIIESSGRPWFRGGSVTGLSDTTPDDMIDEKTLPPDVANHIKVISKPTKKPPKLRAAAKIESAPANPIFLYASETTDDPFWRDIFKRMSRNFYRKGFRFFPSSSSTASSSAGQQRKGSSYTSNPTGDFEDDGSRNHTREEEEGEEEGTQNNNTVGRFVYRSKTKEYSILVPENPKEAFVTVKSFMKQHGGLMSEMDQMLLDRIILDYSVDPFEALPKEWSEVKGSGSRSMLITHYAEILKSSFDLSDHETKDLISTINLGVASGYIGDGSIHLKHGAIDHIKGLRKDKETGEFYISIEEAMKYTVTRPNNSMSTSVGRKNNKQMQSKRSTKVLNLYRDFIKNFDESSYSSSHPSTTIPKNDRNRFPTTKQHQEESGSAAEDSATTTETSTTAFFPSPPPVPQQQPKKRGRKKAVAFDFKDEKLDSLKDDPYRFVLNTYKTPAPAVIFGSALEVVEKYFNYIMTGKGKTNLEKEDPIFKQFLSDEIDEEDDDNVSSSFDEPDGDANPDDHLSKKEIKPFKIASRLASIIKIKRDEEVSNKFPDINEIIDGIKFISDNLVKINVASITAASIGFVFSSSLAPSSSTTASERNHLSLVKSIKENLERIDFSKRVALEFAKNVVYSNSRKHQIKFFCIPEGIRKLFEALILRTELFRGILAASSSSPSGGSSSYGVDLIMPYHLKMEDTIRFNGEKSISSENQKFLKRLFGCRPEENDETIESRHHNVDVDDYEDTADDEEDACSSEEEDFSNTSTSFSNFKTIESKNNSRKHKYLVKISDDIIKDTLNFYKYRASSSDIIKDTDIKVIRKAETLAYSHIDRLFKTKRTVLETILNTYTTPVTSTNELSAWTTPESPSVLYGGSASKPGASIKRWWRLVDLISKKKDTTSQKSHLQISKK